MGLNAPGVSRLTRYRPPTTLEKYFQEVGRAGRSSQAAEAIMYHNNNDIAANRKGLHPEVTLFVKNESSCLRKHLLHYFGFDNILYNGPPGRCCSNYKKLSA